MKKINNLVLLSAFVVPMASQAASIGALVEGGLWGEFEDGGLDVNYAYVSGDQASSSALPAEYAYSYQAESSFNAGELTPVLRAAAYSDDLSVMSDPYISAGAYAYQSYRNTSGATQTFTLNLNLHGDVLDNPSSYIDSEVNIFTGADLFASYSDCSGSAEYLRGFASWSCGSALGTGFTPYIEMTAGESTINDSVSFSVGAGESFSVYAELRALTFGGYADAFGTLVMTFDDTTNLQALGEMPAEVPVPAAVWLFSSGMIGLLAAARRKQ